jgi:hypothetical protein
MASRIAIKFCQNSAPNLFVKIVIKNIRIILDYGNIKKNVT